jgi:hypothetical protein
MDTSFPAYCIFVTVSGLMLFIGAMLDGHLGFALGFLGAALFCAYAAVDD